MKHLLIVGLFMGLFLESHGQTIGTAGDMSTLEPTMIIDKPTAGMLRRADYHITANFFQRGGVLAGVSVGLFDRFSFGISYGGTGIIGPDKIEMNPLPGVRAKLRIVQETTMMPAIAIGFDSQGKEPYLDSLKRYTIKSTGFYAVASKNYEMLGHLSLHGGFNYSLENKDGDKDLNLFVGAEKSLGDILSVLVEYDFAVNDNTQSVGQGHGYFNLGFRLSAGEGLMIGFDLKNMTKNQRNITIANRVLQIEYVGRF
ncbi:MAG: hypothetical protein HBSIN02_16680 [Bacteroidia bacterium]|nr:MAG: hypothetical protein HBSIN02_16680 [Bacteroidia bacterium]